MSQIISTTYSPAYYTGPRGIGMTVDLWGSLILIFIASIKSRKGKEVCFGRGENRQCPAVPSKRHQSLESAVAWGAAYQLISIAKHVPKNIAAPHARGLTGLGTGRCVQAEAASSGLKDQKQLSCQGALPGAVATDSCEVVPDVSGVLAPWG